MSALTWSADPVEVCRILREYANAMDNNARELRKLAFKIEEPPEGVRVALDFPRVTFVGPTVDLSGCTAST